VDVLALGLALGRQAEAVQPITRRTFRPIMRLARATTSVAV